MSEIREKREAMLKVAVGNPKYNMPTYVREDPVSLKSLQWITQNYFKSNPINENGKQIVEWATKLL